MAQPGHATDIYTYRYIGQDLRTTYAETAERGGDGMSYYREQFELGTATATFYIAAPCDGKLVRMECNPLTTTDATHTIQLVGTNESNSDAAMFTQLWDADPVATKEVVNAATLTTTAADLLVDEGDLIKIVYTEGDTTAGGTVVLTFENF